VRVGSALGRPTASAPELFSAGISLFASSLFKVSSMGDARGVIEHVKQYPILVH
jgi:hypothetical protein